MWQSKVVFLASCFFCVVTEFASAAESIVNFGVGENQFSVTFVTIGNAGNAPDNTGSPRLAGAVGYAYGIGKFEVSREIITKSNAAGQLGITLEDMSWVEGGARPGMPATRVTWNEAARFVNWLNESQGYPKAYKFAKQPGEAGYGANENLQLWTTADAGFDASNPFRNTQARYVLPSIDEWYKAAYYDPAAEGGAGGYWNYPTGTNSAPTPVRRGTEPGTAVFLQRVDYGPADVDQAGGLSPYGVMGLGGNVFEWQETDRDGVNDSPSAMRSQRGGIWGDPANFLASHVAGFFPPGNESFQSGFRVVSVPEPGLSGAFCWACLIMLGKWVRSRVPRSSLRAV